MAEPKFEDVAAWLMENSDKEGTSDYVHMTGAFKALDPKRQTEAKAPTKTWSEDMLGRAKLAFGMAPEDHAKAGGAEDVPNLEDIMAAKRLTSDPYSAENTADRVLTGAISGIPDTGIALYNAGARTVGAGDSQIPYLGQQMLENSGAAPLPADAPLWRQLSEAGGSAFLGGGAGAGATALNTARAAGTGVAGTVARVAAPTVVPTLTGAAGGEAGSWAGKALGDEETGRLLGSLLGGSATSIGPAARSITHQLYASKGRPDAPFIMQAAERQGVTPTAGMLATDRPGIFGNDSVVRREQRFSGLPGSADIIQQARTNARNQIGDAYDASAAARGAVDVQPTPGTIGAKVNVAARESAEALRGASDARQGLLQEWIGADSPVNVSPIFRRGYDMVADPAANLTPSQRQGIDARLTDQLMPLVTRNAAGDPIPPPGMGHNGGPPMAGETSPYGFVRGFRTELGQAIDTPAGGRLPPASALYEPTTSAMRDTAQRSGVDPRDFNTIQNQTRAVERTTPEVPGGPIGDYPTLQRYINEDPAKAYNYLERGRQDPAVPGILEATGHPAVGEIFGDLMRKLGLENINNPQGGARGPANFDNTWTRMHPESRETMLGPELGNVSDQVALARALNIPTQQTGLTRALGGQGDSVANKVVGSEALGHLGNYLAGPLGAVLGRILGVVGPSGFRGQRASVMEGPTARNALAGRPGPAGIDQLSAALAAIQAENQQNRPPAP